MNLNALVISNEILCKNNMIMRLSAPEIANSAKPGQFLNILCSSDNRLMLRRPISIMDSDAENGYVDIGYEIRGEGTKLLAKWKKGDKIDVMGPLGNGFDIENNFRNIAVVGGGIGIYPLYYLVKSLGKCNIDVFMGYQCAGNIILENEFIEEGCNIYLSTDDGSKGHRGYITELFSQIYKPGRYDMIFVCGPEIMSRKVVSMVRGNGDRSQVSLEERMGCGIGACLVCSCEVKTAEGLGRKTVCKDGPVFDGDIVFPEVE